MKKTIRLSWDEYFMSIAYLVSYRSTCLRRKVGAVLVKEKRILATGYNGAPSGLPHCETTGCLREKLKVPSGERHELCRGLHAEQNVILQCAYYGISTKDSILYLTDTPCGICAKMIVNAKIRKVVHHGFYPDKLALEILQQGKVILEKINLVQKNGIYRKVN